MMIKRAAAGVIAIVAMLSLAGCPETGGESDQSCGWTGPSAPPADLPDECNDNPSTEDEE